MGRGSLREQTDEKIRIALRMECRMGYDCRDCGNPKPHRGCKRTPFWSDPEAPARLPWKPGQFFGLKDTDTGFQW
jgi:hypothetical protein